MAGNTELMNVMYKKDIQGCSMIIPSKTKEKNYCLNMIINNKIKGILPLELCIVDNICYYHYEITHHEELFYLLEKKQLQYSQIKVILLNLIQAILNGKEYLLYEDDFILDPQYIYLNPETNDILLCYLIGYNQKIMEQVSSFIEFLMNKVNYKDDKAVLLIYGLYKISKADGVTFYKLIEYLQEKKEEGSEGCNNKFIETRNIPIIQEEKKIISNGNKVTEKKHSMDHRQEKIYSEEEVLEYPFQIKIILCFTFLLGIGIFIICLRFGILTNSIGNKIDGAKVFGALLFIGTMEAYVYGKLLNKDKKIIKIKEKVEYKDNLGQWHREGKGGKTQLLKEVEGDKTTILLEPRIDWEGYELVPMDVLENKKIKLLDMPFFIGNIGGKKAGTIESEVISRYHAKVEYVKDKFYISDLNSTNGTYLNGKRLESNQRNVLYPEDEVMFANIRYTFQKRM